MIHPHYASAEVRRDRETAQRWLGTLGGRDDDVESGMFFASADHVRAAIENAAARKGTHAVVLDCETIPFLDVTAARMLSQLAADLGHRGVRLVLAGEIGQVRDMIAAVTSQDAAAEYHRMLTSHRAKVNGPVFVLGWLIGLGIVGAIVLAIAGPGGASKSGAPATWVSWLKIALGVLLLLVAIRQFQSRPHGGEEPVMPKWMATIDKTTPLAALGLAAALSGANPKNLLLAVSGAATIAQTGIPTGQQAIAYAVFALIGTLGVGIPVGIYFTLGQRSEKILAGLKDWMSAHNAVIMTVLCLIIAAKLIGDAITGLTS